MIFGVDVSCRILYSLVGYSYVSDSGSITSVGEEIANLSAIVNFTCTYICGFCSERFPLPLGAWMGCVILLWHSLSLPYNYSMEILIYKFKKIIGNPNFSDRFKGIVNRFKRAGYTLDITRHTACLV